MEKFRREWLMTWHTDRRAICSDEEEHMTFYKSRFNLCILETLEQSVYSTWKEALSRRSPSTQISRDLDRLSPRNPCNGVVICFGGDLKRGSLPTAYFFPRCQRIRGSFWAIIRARENKNYFLRSETNWNLSLIIDGFRRAAFNAIVVLGYQVTLLLNYWPWCRQVKASLQRASITLSKVLISNTQICTE